MDFNFNFKYLGISNKYLKSGVYINNIYLIFFQTGLMDIVIAFEWIEILFPRVNILRRFSILKISFVAFVFSVLVNFPVNIVRAVEKQQFKMDSNETITLSAYGKSLLAANLPNRILYIVFKI